MKRTPAYAYLRVSSRGQVKGHGYARQAEAIDRYAKSAGYKIVKTFKDAHTGTEAQRPGWNAMIASIAANGVNVILVESMDRFTRELDPECRLKISSA